MSTEDIKITTEGLMNGNWQIKISGIKDKDLSNTEVKILRLFNRAKKPGLLLCNSCCSQPRKDGWKVCENCHKKLLAANPRRHHMNARESLLKK